MNPPDPIHPAAALAAMAGMGVSGVAEVLPMRVGSRASLTLFEAAGLADAWHRSRREPLADEQLRRLHRALRDQLGLPAATAVARDAGVRAAEVLLAHHIGSGCQALLRRLPARLAERLLQRELLRLSWAFAADAHVQLAPGRLTVQGSPLCRGVRSDTPSCDFVCALVERLYAVLVHPDARCVERACESCGAPACEFTIGW